MLEVYLITLALAVGLGLAAVIALLAASRTVRLAGVFSPKSDEYLLFLAACAFVFAVGFLDDWKVLGWRPKLLAQVAAASAVYAAGYRIEEGGLPWGPEFDLGILAPVATVL